LQELTPFVYRRYLDFGALDALREMKRKIDLKTTRAEDYHRNVKLGRGGIREIEFFVQCLQLIFGGKDPELRLRGTLDTAALLAERGHITQEARRLLTNAYRFLRQVEHRLQIARERQTHLLPEGDDAMTRVAVRCGFPDRTNFLARYHTVTEQVHDIYQSLFQARQETEGAIMDPMVEELLLCDPANDGCLSPLDRAGFRRPEQARGILRIFRTGPRGLALTESTRRIYDRLAPRMLHEIIQAPDPDMALSHAEGFLNKIGNRTALLAILVEKPSVLRILVRLFGTSVYLSRHLNQHPHQVDHLFSWDTMEKRLNRDTLRRELVRHMEGENDEEARLAALREFKNAAVLRLGVRDLSGIAELPEVMAGLSAIADVMLEQVMREAQTRMEARYGVPRWTDTEGRSHTAPFVILALGKLGGDELNYSSDLDLIFIHGCPGGDTAHTDGPHALPNAQFFARLGQKIITAISAFTRGGKLYELDMRLRPSGNAGPLVTSLGAFSSYHHNEAWTWEHQALTRARVVAGDLELTRRVQEEIRAILTLPRDAEQVRREVVEMRERMFQDKRPPADVVDIKQTRGGIVDIEFLTQYLILSHAARHPEIAHRNVVRALLACERAKRLSAKKRTRLEEAYGFYRLVENRLRLLHGRSENRIGPDPHIKRQIARLCGLDDETDITVLLHDHFNRVFAIYQKMLTP
jgi:glutamate-ammonia-ligase adenylyltransferase